MSSRSISNNSDYAYFSSQIEETSQTLDKHTSLNLKALEGLKRQIASWIIPSQDDDRQLSEQKLDIQRRFSLLEERIAKPLPAICYKDVIGPVVLLALTLVGLVYLQTKGIS